MEDVEALRSVRALENFTVLGSPVPRELHQPLAAALRSIPALKSLTIFDCELRDPFVQGVAMGVQTWPALTVLDLGCAQVSAAAAKSVVHALEGVHALHSLTLVTRENARRADWADAQASAAAVDAAAAVQGGTGSNGAALGRNDGVEVDGGYSEDSDAYAASDPESIKADHGWRAVFATMSSAEMTEINRLAAEHSVPLHWFAGQG